MIKRGNRTSETSCTIRRQIRTWPSVCRIDSEMDPMRIRLTTRILVALLALVIFLAFVVLYGYHARTHGVIGVTGALCPIWWRTVVQS